MGYKGYRVLDLETHRIHISHNVVFHEHIFPFAQLVPSSTAELLSDRVLPKPISHNVDTNLSRSTHDLLIDSHDSYVVTKSLDTSMPYRSWPRRITQPPTYLKDYHCYFIAALHSTSTTFTLSSFLLWTRLSQAHSIFFLVTFFLS